jgi:non-specific serine/threonine protein kinase
VSSAAWGLANVLCARGSVDEAGALLGEALTVARDLHDAHGVTQCLEALAQVAHDRAGHTTAAMLLGYTAAQRRHHEAPLSEADRSRSAATEASLIRALGPAAAERARRDGRLLDTRQAVALGHAVANGQMSTDRSIPSTVLTRREAQVVALVTAGRTNRQIGSALGIAEKTAEVHLQHVMAKVGAHNRAEVAAWAVRQGVPGSG